MDIKTYWNEYMEQRKLDGKKGNPAKDLVEMTLLRTFIAMETVPYTIEKNRRSYLDITIKKQLKWIL